MVEVKAPGLRIQLTKTGLDYGAVVGREVLNQQLPKVRYLLYQCSQDWNLEAMIR